jgi:hypothetical protein
LCKLGATYSIRIADRGVNNSNTSFPYCTNGKLPVCRKAKLANKKDIKRNPKCVSYFRRDWHTPSRQTKYHGIFKFSFKKFGR